MKKHIVLSVILAGILLMSACGTQKKMEPVLCGHEAYADLIARLEAGDYDGARSLINTIEGKSFSAETESVETPQTESAAPEETEAAPTQPAAVIPQDCETVKLTKYNVRDYFEFKETYFISERSGCMQYIALKDAHQNRLISAEGVKLEVSYLLCEAHGETDLKAEVFRPEYFEITSREKEFRTVKLDSDGIGWINQMIYFSKLGYFPNFAMDVELISASGELILSAQ